ncbi:cell shape-determining protein [Halobacteriales archaeon QS_8_69_73]|nr:MAG: cell shape-determining protein [Halobacteriales archaeon QS_8_69_73]
MDPPGARFDAADSRGRADADTVVGRRRLLVSVGTAGLAGLAGCARFDDGDYDRRQAAFDPERRSDGETYPGDDVTVFRRGTRRLGYYPDAVVPDAVAVAWSEPVNEIGHTAAKASPRPTPDGELLVVPDDAGRVHGFTPAGERRWTTATGAGDSLGFHGTPAIVDGVAYVGGYDGAVYALDVATGEPVWKTSRWQLGGAVAVGSSPAYWDGVLYLVAEYNHPGMDPSGAMWALDAATGRPLWHDDRPWGMPHPSPAIDPVAERAVIGSNDGVVYAWEFPSMAFAWSFETDAQVKGTVATYDGGAIVGSWDGYVRRLNLDDGDLEWRFETGEVTMSNPGVDPEAGVVYVGSDDRDVHALDVDTGERLWSQDVGGHVIGSLTVTPECVLVGSYDTRLYCLEKATGAVRWTVEGVGHATSEAVPLDGRIFYAERADLSGYWDDDAETVLEKRGRVYGLRPA